MTSDPETPVEPHRAETAVAAPTVVYARADERVELVRLEWPFTVDGVYYDHIPVRRISVADIDAAIETAKAGEAVKFPMFGVPDHILKFIDADDDDAVSEAVNRFLPRRYRTKTA